MGQRPLNQGSIIFQDARIPQKYMVIPNSDFINATAGQGLAYVKKAAALANLELGVLRPAVVHYITQACDEIIAGKLHDQFIVDIMQGGARPPANRWSPGFSLLRAEAG